MWPRKSVVADAATGPVSAATSRAQPVPNAAVRPGPHPLGPRRSRSAAAR